MTPAHTRPVTPVADPELLKAFEMGNRKGEKMSRAGGSSLSIKSETLDLAMGLSWSTYLASRSRLVPHTTSST